MEKLSPNRAQLFVRNKYTVFTMHEWHCSSPVCEQKFFRGATVLQLSTSTLRYLNNKLKSIESSLALLFGPKKKIIGHESYTIL